MYFKRTIFVCSLVGLFVAIGCQPPLADLQNIKPAQQPSGSEIIDQVFDHHNPTVDDMRMSAEEAAEHISGTGNWKPVTLPDANRTSIGQYGSTAITKDHTRFAMEVRQTKQGVY